MPVIIIEETEGLYRGIILRGWSLPLAGVPFGTQQRKKINYFNGNPVGQLQINGPQWLPTTINGKWNDVNLQRDDSAAKLINFPGLLPVARAGDFGTSGSTFDSGGAVPYQEARTARALRDAMMRICRGGMLLRFEWGSILRYGVLESFTPTHDREEDLLWEANFEWTGDTAAQPTLSKAKTDLPSLIRRLIGLAQGVLAALKRGFFLTEIWSRKITGIATRLGNLTEDLIDVLGRLVDIALLPLDVLGTLRAMAIGITLAANDLIDQMSSLGAAVATAETRDTAQAALDSALQSEVRRLLIELAAEGRLAVEEIDRFSGPEIKSIVILTAGMTLYDVSLAEYGVANHWKDIAEYNGIVGSVHPPGKSVRVPVL